jgi:glycosyltransferase involved in cell wall biosynthesis
MAAAQVDDAVPVTFVISHAQSGGSERYLELLVERLEPGWVRGILSLQRGPFVDRLRERGIPVDVVETGARLSMLPAARGVRRVLKQQHPAVIHANGVKAALVTALAGPGIPIVWVKHDFSWDGPLATLIASRCRQVVGVSAAVTETFGPRQRRKVHVVHNGIPPIAADRDAGRELVRGLLGGADPDDAVILVGRLHPAKGHIELVEAIPRILERRPQTRFLMLGGEDPYQLPYARSVRERVTELGIDYAVTFQPHHDDAPTVIAGCAVAVMPSVPDERGMGREGFGLVGLEAMAVGTPVVAYGAGALPEVLGECAEMVPEYDREALADTVVRLLDDPGRRAELIECGREMMRTRYSLEATVAGMVERYREAASSR